MNLTHPQNKDYYFPVPAKSGAGRRTPLENHRRTGRQLCFAAFFVRDSTVLWWVGRGAFVPAASVGAVVLHLFDPSPSERRTSLVMALSPTEIYIVRDSHPSCALTVPLEDIVTCVKASKTLVSITQYHLTRTTLPDGGEETLVAAIDKYSALAESLQALIDQHEEACNEL